MTEDTKLKHLIRDIYATRDDEIQCRDAAELVARCSDARLTDDQVHQRYPQLWHHFGVCPDCAKEYQAVMALARDEAEGRLPQIGQISPVPNEAEIQMQNKVEEIVSVLFPGFSTAMAAGITRGKELAVEPKTIAFPDGGVSVTVDIAPAASNPQRRDLYCTARTENDRPTQSLEGTPVWLQTSEEQNVVVEQTLDDFGDALFEAIAPGTYDLRLYLAGKEYRIAQMDIP